MGFHEVLTRLISGLIVFPVFLPVVLAVSHGVRLAEDATGIAFLNNVTIQVLVVGLAGVIAIAIVWRVLRWIEPQHWQGGGPGIWLMRACMDAAIAALAEFALFYPVKTAYIAFWDPGAFKGFLGGLDAIFVIPIAGILCLLVAILLISLRRAGMFGPQS